MRKFAPRRIGEAMPRAADLRVGGASCRAGAVPRDGFAPVSEAGSSAGRAGLCEAGPESEPARERMHSTSNPAAAHLYMPNLVSQNWHAGQVKLAVKES